jgi:hypothetical protein
MGADEKGNITCVQKNSPGQVPLDIMDSIVDVVIEKTGEIRRKFLQEVPVKLAGSP